MNKEIWKDIQGFEGVYQISNFGRVKSLARTDKRGYRRKEKIMKTNLNTRGYVHAILNKNSYLIHRLVLSSFVGEKPSEKHVVNHKNGIKTDNAVSNLEWVTQKENVIHAHRNKLVKQAYGENRHNAVFTNEQAEMIRIEYMETNTSQYKLAAKYGVSQAAVWRILANKTYVKGRG